MVHSTDQETLAGLAYDLDIYERFMKEVSFQNLIVLCPTQL